MCFEPSIYERIARARSDLRMGVGVVLDGETTGVFVWSAETISEEQFTALKAMDNETVLAITSRRAQTLKARVYDEDVARIQLPKDASLSWVQSISDPADDLNTPMKGPLISDRDGSAEAHRVAIALCKAAQLLPAVLVMPLDNPKEFALKHQLTALPFEQTRDVLPEQNIMTKVVHAQLPLEVSEAGQLHIYRPEDGGEEHYAIEIGKPDRDKPVLCRLHSACFTGDIIGSLKCDCGPQLRAALAHMGQEGSGILLYLNQEGRGIGLANKMRAYSLQNQGFDTVEANHRLGFEDDERDFRLGSEILRVMGVGSVRLLTNNPAKIDMMEAQGISVAERVPLKVGETAHNHHYLAVKAKKSGHLL